MKRTVFATSLSGFAAGAVVDQLTDDVRRQLAASIAQLARAEWIRLAQRSLTSSRADYLQGIQGVEMAGQSAQVVLMGKRANDVENGTEAYDMRTTLLGPNVPVVERGMGRGKHASEGGGFYRAIPFRHQGPGSRGTHGAPMGKAHAAHLGPDEAAALGRKIFAHARKLAPTVGGPYKASGGNVKGAAPVSAQRVRYGGRLPAGLAPKLAPHHKTDIYAGMIQQQKTYKKATQNTYTTFRTISTRSQSGWMAKAKPGLNLLDKVAHHTQKEGTAFIRTFLEKAGGKL